MKDQPPKLLGILETALPVQDLRASARFYRDQFGFPVLMESERLLALNVANRSVLLLFPKGGTEDAVETTGGTIPGHGAGGRCHFAFSIPPEEFENWHSYFVAKGIGIESVVNWPGGSRSLYLRDPDQHLVELITPGFWQFGEVV